MYLLHRGVCGVCVFVGVFASSKCCRGVGTAAGQLHPSVGGEPLKANDLCKCAALSTSSRLYFCLMCMLHPRVFALSRCSRRRPIQIQILCYHICVFNVFASSRCICFIQAYLLHPSVGCLLKTDDLGTGQPYLLHPSVFACQVYLLHPSIFGVFASYKCICFIQA